MPDTIKVVLMDDAVEFIKSQPRKVQEKITYNMRKVAQGVMDNKLFKKLEASDVWEFRTVFLGNCYRLFAFWDTESGCLVVATHGIMKKSMKIPAKEIRRAEEIRRKYFESKGKWENSI